MLSFSEGVIWRNADTQNWKSWKKWSSQGSLLARSEIRDRVGRDSINYRTVSELYLFNQRFRKQNLTKAMTVLSEAFIFFTITITGYSSAEFIRIWRDSTVMSDDFLLPDSHCPGYKSQCNNFNGAALSLCWCYCKDLQGQTAAFYESSYGCLQVRDVRQQAGMNVSRLLKS